MKWLGFTYHSNTDLKTLAVFSIIEGDLELLWRKTLSQGLPFQAAKKIVIQQVSLHFSCLESLANSTAQRTLAIALKRMEEKVSIGIIKAIDSAVERKKRVPSNPFTNLKGSQELVDWQTFLSQGQAIEELKIKLVDTVTDESQSILKSPLTSYHAGALNLLDLLSATVTRMNGTDENKDRQTHMITWTCVCFLRTPIITKTNSLSTN